MQGGVWVDSGSATRRRAVQEGRQAPWPLWGSPAGLFRYMTTSGRVCGAQKGLQVAA